MTSTETSPLDLEGSRAAKKQHDTYVSWLNQQFKQIKNARTQTERQWYINLAFYFGKQNVQLMRPEVSNLNSSTRLYVPPAPYWRSRPVINRIRPTIRTELAQLTANRPNASVVPSSSEDRDMYAAMAAEQIWYNEYSEKKLKAVIRRAMWWTLLTGSGFIKTYWDPRKGPMDEETGLPVGDICYNHETPFHIFVPDLREEELENQPFIIHAQTKSPDYIKQHFGNVELYRSSAEANDILDDSFLNLIGTQTLDKQKSVLVLEAWIKPGMVGMFPEGAFFTVVGDKIVYGQQGWPYKHELYPFTKFDHIPSGKFYSSSIIEDLVPLQKEFNRTRGQIIEAKNRMAKPQLSAPRGSVDASKITTEPGQVIEYTPGLDPPQPIPLQSLPNYVIQELERILQDWSDISGQHEVSHGEVPPGVTAATAISYLQERDESKLSPTFDSLEEGVEKVARTALNYVHEFWTTERTVKVTGPDGSFDAMAFKGSDLRNNLDIRIEGGSSLPVSKAARQAFIMDMMKLGFIEPNKGLEIMEMGGINKLYEQIQVDQRQSQRENLRMSKVTEEMLMEYQQQNTQMLMQDPTAFGEPPSDPETGEPLIDPATGAPAMATPPIIVPVNTWDNHKAHIEYHNNFRKGQAFEQMPEFVKQLFEEHVNQHIQAMGMETETMEPRASVGLPPDPMAPEEEQQDNSQQPGPQPMPEMSGEQNATVG